MKVASLPLSEHHRYIPASCQPATLLPNPAVSLLQPLHLPLTHSLPVLFMSARTPYQPGAATVAESIFPAIIAAHRQNLPVIHTSNRPFPAPENRYVIDISKYILSLGFWPTTCS
jgi:hypothetical protein